MKTLLFHSMQKGNLCVTTAESTQGSACFYQGDVTLNEYTAGSQGRTLIRTIDLGAKCEVTSLAFGGGNVYVTLAQNQSVGGLSSESIVTYGPTSNGPKTTSRIPISVNKCLSVYETTSDLSGNLFVGCESGDVYEYPGGHLPRRHLLSVSGPFAVDSVEKLGAKSPFKTISGPATGLAIGCPGRLTIATVP
jgi:hypothetical protein